MFASCGNQDQPLELSEGADAVVILLRLLHDPPQPYVSVVEEGGRALTPPPASPEVNQAIPFPVLRVAFDLSDKYMLSTELSNALHSHLSAHITTEPLQVYGFACALGLEKLAALASKYLLHPPLWTYSAEEIRVIPTVVALHRLVRLHAVREQKLKEILMEEPLFPHGYGMCSAHGALAKIRWEERKRALQPQVRAGTWA
jgi:hypothetical protein